MAALKAARARRAAHAANRMSRLAFLVLAIAVVGFLIKGANSPANPYLAPAPGQVTRTGFSSFGAVYFTVHAGPKLAAAKHPACALLASTPAQQAQGLMGQKSLDGLPGMVFEFAQPTTDRFYMKDTLFPLSIAWFGSGGVFAASLNMPPCPPTTRLCPTYEAGQPYSLALEVPEGKLASYGIGPGSTMQLGGPCTL